MASKLGMPKRVVRKIGYAVRKNKDISLKNQVVRQKRNEERARLKSIEDARKTEENAQKREE